MERALTGTWLPDGGWHCGCHVRQEDHASGFRHYRHGSRRCGLTSPSVVLARTPGKASGAGSDRRCRPTSAARGQQATSATSADTIDLNTPPTRRASPASPATSSRGRRSMASRDLPRARRLERQPAQPDRAPSAIVQRTRTRAASTARPARARTATLIDDDVRPGEFPAARRQRGERRSGRGCVRRAGSIPSGAGRACARRFAARRPGRVTHWRSRSQAGGRTRRHADAGLAEPSRHLGRR